MTGCVVVTGANGSLGRAVRATLEAKGWSVVGLDVTAGGGSGDEAETLAVDLTDAAKTSELIDAIAAKAGGIDGLVNVAGGFVWKLFGDNALEEFDRMYALNLKTAANASYGALAHLKKTKGAIVNTGAAAARSPGEGMAPYAASKAGVAALTESLAAECRGSGVRVNAVLPTILDTPANRNDMPDTDPGDWVALEDAANVIAYLLSDEARAVTGAQLVLS